MAAEVNVQVPSNIAGWSTRPAPFNTTKHGINVKFSVDYTIAERLESEEYRDNAVAYTAETMPLGQVWQATILRTRGWGSGLVS